MIKNIVLENVRVSARMGVSLIDVDGIQFSGCRIDVKTSPLVIVDQGSNVTLKGGEYPGTPDVFLKVGGERSGNIHLTGIDAANAKNAIVVGDGAKADAVKRD